MRDPIQLFKVFMAPTAAEEVSKILNSGYIGQGPKVEEFENQLKTFLNTDRVLTLNSGTSGLHLALHLLKNPQNNIKNYDGLAFWEEKCYNIIIQQERDPEAGSSLFFVLGFSFAKRYVDG